MLACPLHPSSSIYKYFDCVYFSLSGVGLFSLMTKLLCFIMIKNVAGNVCCLPRMKHIKVSRKLPLSLMNSFTNPGEFSPNIKL